MAGELRALMAMTSGKLSLDQGFAPTSSLSPNPHNIRLGIDQGEVDKLAESITAVGILEPLVVTPLGQVVAGHRRLLAARQLKLENVPIVVKDLTLHQQREVMLIENLQRTNLSPIEEARAFKVLVDGSTTRDVARRVGVQTNHIHTRLLLLKLDDVVQTMVHRGDLPVRSATLLLQVADKARQRQMATMAANRGLSAAELERIINRGTGALSSPSHPKPDVKRDSPSNQTASEKPEQSPGRKQVLARLDVTRDRSVDIADIQALFNDVCCACGMQDLPEYCAACPMLQLVDLVLLKVEKVHAAA